MSYNRRQRGHEPPLLRWALLLGLALLLAGCGPVRTYCFRAQDAMKGQCNPEVAHFCVGSTGTLCLESREVRIVNPAGVVVFDGAVCDRVLANDCSLPDAP